MVTDNITPEIQRIKSELLKLSNIRITVGIQGDEDSELLKIAKVHEYGAEIKMTDKMRRFMGAKGFFDDYRDSGTESSYVPPAGKVKGINTELRSVVIPERSFIRASYAQGRSQIIEAYKSAVVHIIKDKWTAEQAANNIGAQALQMVHDYFNTKLKPPKSDITKKFSAQEQPLYDTGRLYNSITFKIEGL